MMQYSPKGEFFYLTIILALYRCKTNQLVKKIFIMIAVFVLVMIASIVIGVQKIVSDVLKRGSA
jgi:hypothetical protein